MVAKGRSRKGRRQPPEAVLRGEAHGMAILTEAQVREIRTKYAGGGTSYRLIGLEYGVNKGTIGMIISGQNWRHV